MPVREVNGGYQWGTSGKVYPTRGQAERQGRAAYARGYRGDARERRRKAARDYMRQEGQ